MTAHGDYTADEGAAVIGSRILDQLTPAEVDALRLIDDGEARAAVLAALDEYADRMRAQWPDKTDAEVAATCQRRADYFLARADERGFVPYLLALYLRGELIDLMEPPA